METSLSILEKLNATGHDGFEGLVRKLLEHLTGNRFYLAKSGYQAGGDMAAQDDGTCIKVECKYYRETSKLKDRDLLGEIVQAHNKKPALDLWVLVTSRDVSMQLFESLKQTGEGYGIEVSVIEKNDEKPSSLEALCAFGEDIVIKHIEKFYENLTGKLGDLKKDLAQISSLTGYDDKVDFLKKSFNPAEIGYGNWIGKQNSWLLEQFSSPDNSRSRFKQVLNVNDCKARVIERKEAYEQLNRWLDRWKEDKEIFALLGEEGDGKTWAVASWVVKQIKTVDVTPVLFINAQDVSSEDIGQMLSDAIFRQLDTPSREGFWNKRVFKWIKRTDIARPLILLIIDGVNENFLFKWRSFLVNFNVEPWRDKIALVLTCRTKFWEKYLSGLRDFKSSSWILPHYNERELNDALMKYNINNDDVTESLLHLLSKPRYFDMAVKYRVRMAESGDITVHRLLYEDYKDRWSRKTNSILTDREFQSIIVKLAEQARIDENKFGEKDFADIIPLKEKKEAILEELVNGGVFVCDEGVEHIFKVEERKLAMGFGLLLYNELKREAAKGEKAIDECVNGFLEPQPEMDFKTFIVGAAVFHAMDKNDFPETGRFYLLRYYINLKNLDQEMFDNFQAYFPCCPDTYFKLTESVWKKSLNDHFLSRIIKYTLYKWVKDKNCTDIFKNKFEEWMGYLNIDHSYLIGAMKEESKKKYRKELRERLGFKLELGYNTFLGYPLILVNEENHISRISSLVLSVVSCAPDRRPFIRAITIKVLKDCILGHQSRHDQISWLLRISQISLWPELEMEVSSLLSQDNIIAKDAAYYLLTYEGSIEAFRLRNALSNDPLGIKEMREEYKKNPCNSFFSWSRENYLNCIDREDIEIEKIIRSMKKLVIEPDLPVPGNFGKRLAACADKINPGSTWKSMGLTKEDHFFESIEDFLFAFSPAAAAKVYRAIIRDMENRDGTCLWWVVARLEELFLILGEKEKNIIEKIWKRLHEKGFAKDEGYSEAYLFRICLPEFSAITQLQMMLKRPEQESDFKDFQLFFKKLTSKSWTLVLRKLKQTNNATELRRILWFISKYPKEVPLEVLKEIRVFFSHSDQTIQEDAFLLFIESSNLELIEEFVSSGWGWEKENSRYENHYGTVILAKFGKKLSYDELRTRIHPNFLGYAVRHRGLKKDEVNKYAEDLDMVWEKINEAQLESPKMTSHKRREKKEDKLLFELGSVWFSNEFYTDALEEVIDTKPDLVKKWLNAVASKSETSDSILRQCLDFYTLLCCLLFKVQPDEGVKLFEILEGRNFDEYPGFNASTLYNNLWRSKQTPAVEKLWNHQFDKCFVDLSLLSLAIKIQRAKHIDWYQQKIDRYLTSDLLHIQAKGIMMLGFLDRQSAYHTLNTLLEEIPECWIHQVIKKALEYWQYNLWAKTWFTRFWESGDDIKAWAAFKLFLKCVDSRYKLWKDEIREEYRHSSFFEKRKTFLDLNERTIDSKLKKNEENLKLKETFLGKEISKEIEPWM